MPSLIAKTCSSVSSAPPCAGRICVTSFLLKRTPSTGIPQSAGRRRTREAPSRASPLATPYSWLPYLYTARESGHHGTPWLRSLTQDKGEKTRLALKRWGATRARQTTSLSLSPSLSLSLSHFLTLSLSLFLTLSLSLFLSLTLSVSLPLSLFFSFSLSLSLSFTLSLSLFLSSFSLSLFLSLSLSFFFFERFRVPERGQRVVAKENCRPA